MACDKMHARIPVAICIGRQIKGIRLGGGGESSIYMIPLECRACEAGMATLNRDTPQTEEKKEIMKQTKACDNCKREITIVAGGYCYVCYQAARGLFGAEKSNAFAAIKAKIESGLWIIENVMAEEASA